MSDRIFSPFYRFGALLAFGFLTLLGCSRTPTELVIYSSRNEQLIKPMFDRYTQETGQAIRFVTDDAGPLSDSALVC